MLLDSQALAGVECMRSTQSAGHGADSTGGAPLKPAKEPRVSDDKAGKLIS